MSTPSLTRRELLAYAAFALPLAMAALPVYVHAPKLYGDHMGLSLALVGTILPAARLLDAVQDPLLGWLSDRAADSRLGRRLLVLISLPLLAGGFVALFHPPIATGFALAAWLLFSLMVVQLGFSMGSISYYAMGAELSRDYHERTRVTATRGALGVIGVLIAAVVPQLLSERVGEAAGLALLSFAFVPLLLVMAAVTLRLPLRRFAVEQPRPRHGIYAALIQTSRSRPYRWLIAVTALSGIAAAIPGTLILFYVQDVLRLSSLSGLFLALYFLFAAAGMPLWIAATRRLGKKAAWLLGMFSSVAAFVWAFLLGSGDAVAFAVVCALSGLAYGAELAIPPAILADIVDGDSQTQSARPDGAYFGVWQMVDKLNLALAAAIAFPLLGLLGYQPGETQPPHSSLSLMYALVPCVIKLAAIACLWIAPIETRSVSPPALISGELSA